MTVCGSERRISNPSAGSGSSRNAARNAAITGLNQVYRRIHAGRDLSRIIIVPGGP
jgi:hypothetical protein